MTIREFLPIDASEYVAGTTVRDTGNFIMTRTVTILPNKRWNGQPFVRVEREWVDKNRTA